MEFIIILVVLTLIDIFLKIVFCVKIKKLKQFEKDEYLDKVVSKYPENTQICEEILKKVKNNTATEFERDALARYYEVTSLKEKEYMDYKYRRRSKCKYNIIFSYEQ